MRVSKVLIVLLMAFGQTVFAQTKADIIEQGDNAYKNENYASAAYFYKRVIDKKGVSSGLVHPYEAKAWVAPPKKNKKDSTDVKLDTNAYAGNEVVLHKLANSYLKNHDYQKAEQWYAIAVNYPIDVVEDDAFDHLPEARLWYGESLMRNGKYDDALKQFEAFKQETSNLEMAKRADKGILGCYFAEDPSSENPEAEVLPADSNMNFGTSSYGVNYFGDETTLIFSAAGPGGTIDDEKTQNSNFLSDFYITQSLMDEGFGKPNNLRMPINTANNEGAGVLSIDRTTFYFTRQSNVNNREVAIWVSKNFNNQWLQPLKLDNKVNADGYKSMHPALSLDGDVLYFSSDRPGGQGGMDIWYCNVDEYGGLSDPINMGPYINTSGDEVTPYYNFFTKTLYFSSDALGGIGGLDIYKTTYNEDDETWSNPKNLGKPFNSTKDDAYFIIDKAQKTGYLSSDRSQCNCGEEYQGSTYCYKIFKFGQPDMKFSISGTVFNAETDEVIPNALISFKDIRGKMEPFFLTTDENGNYERDLEVGWELFLKAQKAKYFGDAASISTQGLTESKHFLQDFFLTPIPMGEIEIPGIEYDFDAATLRPKSKEILDELVQFLELNDNITIEIRSHTDSRGNDDYNLNLSNKRAASVVKYLVEHGINPARLESIGMGEKEPLDDCSQYPDCGDTGNSDCDCHQKNRRTAFKTTSEDFKDVFKGN
ncbi:MAG: OmpA family protein [Flavobacteriales bacterium]|nr:OmpA family protein [Flavobacteriales bacterium]